MTEFAITSDGLRIAYDRAGAGPAVMLVHGFGSSRAQNWQSTGWYASLAQAGLSLVAMDCRGHGESDKPHDPLLY
ncbi:MAG: alpha/beta fold hydrolase, partial [Rhizomicrobium sp.]